MQNARLICTRALVEVAWILVQKRWQNCAANHNVSEAVGSISTEPLAKAFSLLDRNWGISACWAPESRAISTAVIGSPTSLKASLNFSFVVSGSGLGS